MTLAEIGAVEEHAQLVGIGLGVRAQLHRLRHRAAHHLQALALAVARDLQQRAAAVVPKQALGRGPSALQLTGDHQVEHLAQFRRIASRAGKGRDLHIEGAAQLQFAGDFQAVIAAAIEQTQGHRLVGGDGLVAHDAQHAGGRTFTPTETAGHGVAKAINQMQTLTGRDQDLPLSHQLGGGRDAHLLVSLQAQLALVADHVAVQRQQAVVAQGLQHHAAAAQRLHAAIGAERNHHVVCTGMTGDQRNVAAIGAAQACKVSAQARAPRQGAGAQGQVAHLGQPQAAGRVSRQFRHIKVQRIGLRAPCIRHTASQHAGAHVLAGLHQQSAGADVQVIRSAIGIGDGTAAGHQAHGTGARFHASQGQSVASVKQDVAVAAGDLGCGRLNDAAAHRNEVNDVALALNVRIQAEVAARHQRELAGRRCCRGIQPEITAHIQHQPACASGRHPGALHGQRGLVAQPGRAGAAGLQAGCAQHEQAGLGPHITGSRDLNRSGREVGQAARGSTCHGQRLQIRRARHAQASQDQRPSALGQPGRTLNAARQACVQGGDLHLKRGIAAAQIARAGVQFNGACTQQAAAVHRSGADADFRSLKGRSHRHSASGDHAVAAGAGDALRGQPGVVDEQVAGVRDQGAAQSTHHRCTPGHDTILVAQGQRAAGTQGAALVQSRVAADGQVAGGLNQDVSAGLHATALQVPHRGCAAGADHALDAEIIEGRNHQVARVVQGNRAVAGPCGGLGHLAAQTVGRIAHGGAGAGAQAHRLDQSRALRHGQTGRSHQADFGGAGVDAGHAEVAARGQAHLSIGALTAVGDDAGIRAHDQRATGLQIGRAATGLDGGSQVHARFRKQAELSAQGAQGCIQVQLRLRTRGLQQQGTATGARGTADREVALSDQHRSSARIFETSLQQLNIHGCQRTQGHAIIGLHRQL